MPSIPSERLFWANCTLLPEETNVRFRVTCTSEALDPDARTVLPITVPAGVPAFTDTRYWNVRVSLGVRVPTVHCSWFPFCVPPPALVMVVSESVLSVTTVFSALLLPALRTVTV